MKEVSFGKVSRTRYVAGTPESIMRGPAAILTIGGFSFYVEAPMGAKRGDFVEYRWDPDRAKGFVINMREGGPVRINLLVAEIVGIG